MGWEREPGKEVEAGKGGEQKERGFGEEVSWGHVLKRERAGG